MTQAIWKLFGSYYLLRHQSPRDNSKYGESCVTRVHTTVTKVHGISCRWLSFTIANHPTRVVWTLVTAGWCGARWGRGRRGSSGSRRSARLRRSWPARRRGRAPAAPEESTIGVRQTTLRVSGPGTLARGVVPVIPSGNQDVRKPVESGCFRTVSKSAAKGRFPGWSTGSRVGAVREMTKGTCVSPSCRANSSRCPKAASFCAGAAGRARS